MSAETEKSPLGWNLLKILRGVLTALGRVPIWRLVSYGGFAAVGAYLFMQYQHQQHCYAMEDREQEATIAREHRQQEAAIASEAARAIALDSLLLAVLPISEILSRATAWGLTTARRRSVGGKPIVLDHVYRILHDQFYAGVMEYNGKTYKGSHEPMVSWSEFEAVQRAFAVTKVTPTSCPKRLEFTYRGLVTCGRCRAIVTAETTTNAYGVRYTYYHCCRKNRRFNFCPERSVDERNLESQIRAALCAIRIPPSLAAEALRIIERDLSERAGTRERFLEEVTNKRAALVLKRRRLDDLLIDGHLTPDSHVARVDEITKESRRLDEQVARLEEPEQLIEQLRATISLVSEAEKCFDRADPPERRNIVRKVFSNLSLADRTLRYEAKKTIALLGDRTKILDVCTR